MSSFRDFRAKTGGFYEPPGKIRQALKENGKNLSAGAGGDGEESHQRRVWASMKKSIESSIGKIDTKCKIDAIFKELLSEANLIRGRGVFSNAIINAQQLTPKYTMHYTTMVALVNSQISMVGELVIKRLIIQFKLNSKKLNNKTKDTSINILLFIAHLINQNVVQESMAMEIARYLLDNGSPEAIEVLLTFIKECGSKLDNSSPESISIILDYLRKGRIKLNTKLQFQLDVFKDHRCDKFAQNPSILPELDLVNPKRQYTHRISFKDKMVSEDDLNFFKFDPEFKENESKYHTIRQSVVFKKTAHEPSPVPTNERKEPPKVIPEKEGVKPREEVKKQAIKKTGKKKIRRERNRGERGKVLLVEKNEIDSVKVDQKPREEVKKRKRKRGKRVRGLSEKKSKSANLSIDLEEDVRKRIEELKLEEKKIQQEKEKLTIERTDIVKNIGNRVEELIVDEKKIKPEVEKYSNQKTDSVNNDYHPNQELYRVFVPEEDTEDELEPMFDEFQDDYASECSKYSYRVSKNLAKLRDEIRQAIRTTMDSEIGLQRLLQIKISNSYFELCTAVVECCGQPSCYLKFYGSLAQKLCQKDSRYGEQFVEIFKDTYDSVRDIESNRIANIAKMFADLLKIDAIPWTVLGHIRLKEDLIKSWHRNFIKILFQKLAELIELSELRKRFKDPQLEDALRGLFPPDNPQNARFAISFFTSIGLIDLTFDFRKKFKKMK